MGRRICAWIALGPSPGLEQEEVCGGRIMCIFTVKDGEKEKQSTKPKPNNPYLATPSLQNTCVCGGCGCALRGAFSATAQSIWPLVF